MRVRAAIHERDVTCCVCGKVLPGRRRDYHLPARKGGGGFLCGRCGREELRRADRGRQNEAAALSEDVDLSVT